MRLTAVCTHTRFALERKYQPHDYDSTKNPTVGDLRRRQCVHRRHRPSTHREVGKQRTAAAKASKPRLIVETASLLTDYKTVMKQVDGLKVYNARLERQIANQEKRIRDIDVYR